MAWPGARRTYAAVQPLALPLAPAGGAPAGYEQLISTQAQVGPVQLVDVPGPGPLPAHLDPAIGALLPGPWLPPGELGSDRQRNRYVPPNSDGRIGRFVIGESALGHRPAFHGYVITGTRPGQADVEVFYPGNGLPPT